MTSVLTLNRATGAGLIALAVFFNLPYARLATTFDYPNILREPATVILTQFTAGGADLILTWYAFALAAMLFIPAALVHALAIGRIGRFPALAISAAVIGALAGLLQAMGLLRWVMVVPELAALPDGAAQFGLIHAYAGVALGEHLGMLLTAFHVGLMAVMQRAEGRPWLAGLGGVTGAAIAVGAFEGLAMALQINGTAFSIGAICGYLLLTVWLIWSGLAVFRQTLLA
jgi:Domain of unknown function (DUF4386)